MGHSIAEKIFIEKSGNPNLKVGDITLAKLDRILGTDITTKISLDAFYLMGAERVHDPSTIALVNDHFVPAKDIAAANMSRSMRLFAEEQDIENYFDLGRSGICHTLLSEKGLVKPGDLVIGADSHTCTAGALGAMATGVGSTDMASAWALGELWFRVPETIRVNVEGRLPEPCGAKDVMLELLARIGIDGATYRVLEFHGSTIETMSMDGRFTLANMAVEAGAKSGILPVDGITLQYLEKVGVAGAEAFDADHDANYGSILDLDVSKLKPKIAQPYLPSNVVDAEQLEGTRVDQVMIGTCTNGRLEDFEVAARYLRGNIVDPSLRLLIIPSTQSIYLELVRRGLMEVFVEAGATITPPTCGACIGGHMGVLTRGEVGLYTSNRNFRGRNGDPGSRVYLSGPAVAAASAVNGSITVPGKSENHAKH